jgi:hypothetical protein
MFKISSIFDRGLWSLVAVAALAVSGAAMATSVEGRVLDGLREPGTSELGTRWSAITDAVMGGVSDMTLTVEASAGHSYYRMRGQVRTANNGGFVQMALPLTRSRGKFDASEFRGLRLRVRGNGERYAVHLRTSDNRAPWDYYTATFVAGPTWQDVDLPFDDFERARDAGPVDSSRLGRVALVGIGRDFEADISLASLALYP